MRRQSLLALLALSACAGDLPRAELIADLRILAVRAEPPSGVVGTDVTLDALVVAPEGAGPVERGWLACIAAGGSVACARASLPASSCADDPEAEACLLGGGETASYRLPMKALEGRAAGQGGQVFILLLVADTSLTTVAACAQAVAASGVVPAGCRIAAKRLTVDAEPPATPAANPTVSSIVVAGEDVTVAVAAGAGAEMPFLSWFVTAGELEDYRTDATGAGLKNKWTPAGTPGTIYVVVRDGNGGEGWGSGGR